MTPFYIYNYFSPSRRGAAPPPDCVVSGDIGLATEAGTGVAPALTSALNVMAFTELDLSTTGTTGKNGN